MKKTLNVGANIALIVAILVSIWLGDNIEASGREIFSSFVILIMGMFIYIQKVAYTKKQE